MADITTPAVADVGVKTTPKDIELCVVANITIPASGGPGIGEKAAVVEMPKNAIVTDATVFGAAGVATMTVSLGDTGAAGRFINAAALGAAGACNRATLGIGYKYTAKTMVNLTFGTAAPTAAQVYTVVIKYKMA